MTDHPTHDDASTIIPECALFVAADEPLLIYASVAAAEQHLEVIDVANGTYPAAYGPRGEQYRVTTDGAGVRVERIGGSNQPDALSALLVRHLAARGHVADPGTPLAQLVAEACRLESQFSPAPGAAGERRAGPILLSGCLALVLALLACLYFLFW